MYSHFILALFLYFLSSLLLSSPQLSSPQPLSPPPTTTTVMRPLCRHRHPTQHQEDPFRQRTAITKHLNRTPHRLLQSSFRSRLRMVHISLARALLARHPSHTLHHYHHNPFRNFRLLSLDLREKPPPLLPPAAAAAAAGTRSHQLAAAVGVTAGVVRVAWEVAWVVMRKRRMMMWIRHL